MGSGDIRPTYVQLLCQDNPPPVTRSAVARSAVPPQLAHGPMQRSEVTATQHPRCVSLTRPPRHGSARLGSARHGSARLGSARHGSARLGSARLGSARHGSAPRGTARHGTARLGSARHGTARLGTAQHGSARLGSARHGSARLGTARLGSAPRGTARLGTGTARHGSARLGSARLGSARLGTARHGTAQHGTARLGSARYIQPALRIRLAAEPIHLAACRPAGGGGSFRRKSDVSDRSPRFRRTSIEARAAAAGRPVIGRRDGGGRASRDERGRRRLDR